jgi:hypothetical protein
MLNKPRRIEIIGRGPSRKPMRPNFEHWIMSTALREGEPLPIDDAVLFWNLHVPSLWEDWFKTSYHTVAFHPTENGLLLDPLTLLIRYGRVFASTVSWMIAQAIEWQVSHILFNGVDLEAATEVRQRDSFFYMVGVARTKGLIIEHVQPRTFDWPIYPNGSA